MAQIGAFYVLPSVPIGCVFVHAMPRLHSTTTARSLREQVVSTSASGAHPPTAIVPNCRDSPASLDWHSLCNYWRLANPNLLVRLGANVMNTPKNMLVASLLFGAAALAPNFARAQAGDDLAARRQAILQQDELVTDDGQIIEQNVAVVPATRATFRNSGDAAPFQEVRWRRGYGGYYGRSYGAYYGGPRGYARYPGYYDPYYGGGYGYGYRAYGPGYGYDRPYYYGRPYGAARVGPLRVIW
jgi:hypothetical protein